MKPAQFIVWSVCTAAVVFGAAPAKAGISYSGDLSVGDNGLIAKGVYNAADTRLNWVVNDETTPGLWHYEYTLTTPTVGGRGISHIIFEVSDDDPGPAFTLANLFSPTSDPDGWIDDPIEIQTFNPGPGNPSMPEAVYGLKFNAADDADETSVTVSFDSDRVPVWGDFYAKGGDDHVVFNAGFATPDPLDPPANGSIRYHILVPDTTTVTTPAPGALVLSGFGIGLLGWFRRRRTTQDTATPCSLASDR